MGTAVARDLLSQVDTAVHMRCWNQYRYPLVILYGFSFSENSSGSCKTSKGELFVLVLIPYLGEAIVVSARTV